VYARRRMRSPGIDTPRPVAANRARHVPGDNAIHRLPPWTPARMNSWRGLVPVELDRVAQSCVGGETRTPTPTGTSPSSYSHAAASEGARAAPFVCRNDARATFRRIGLPAGMRAREGRDASDLIDMLRLGRLPEAWIAPPATRELRELVHVAEARSCTTRGWSPGRAGFRSLRRAQKVVRVASAAF
jgi:hypothetical protein